ncbi:MalM family protein [Aliagarivorans marinus]|uniref:MalM family protein n=1 Tax=Aliagarivorans marinus TaxID=561965 RepID=UPI00047CEC60|nr:MalM family protein [Aliagarivorans marinus]
MLDLTSDSSVVYVSPSKADGILAESGVCCSTLSELTYKSVSANYHQDEFLDENRQSFEFVSGASFVLAYQIPDGADNLPITISSLIDQTTFAPQAVMLNEQFQVTRMVPGEHFMYREAKGFEPNRLVTSFNLRRVALPDAKERYLLIYTTDQLKSGSTEVTHPARIEAKATSKADPGVPNIDVPHSAMGVVEVKFGALESREWLSGPLFGGRSDSEAKSVAIDANNKQVAESGVTVLETASALAPVAASEVVAEASDEPVISPARLTEAESFYNQLIQRYVAEGDIAKALALVEEAEGIGSKSARDTFIEAVKAN